jgi:peptide chain release factor 1
MLDKLDDMLIRYKGIEDQVNDPEVIGNQDVWRKLMKERSELTPIVEKYLLYKDARQNIEDSLKMIDEETDEDMKELAREELNENAEVVEVLENEIKILLIPVDPNDKKNVFVEIRSGAGGDEAALFAAELYRMYTRYAERMRWKVEISSINENGIGGIKEVVFLITGEGAYSKLKYESGVHRVQRVPATESSGRLHTSTVTVAVLPEAEDVEVEIDMNDIRVDVFRSSGNGGQSVNTTDSAVRITHAPSGFVVSCQDEKSQLKNKLKAMKELRTRLYDQQLRAQQAELSADRKSQVGTGDRSEKIRTYNFPQGRITDHRIHLSLFRVDAIMDGDIDEFIDSLTTADQTAKLQHMAE